MTTIGSPPVGNIDEDMLPPDVASCIQRLDEEVLNVLESDYWFNQDTNITLTPDPTTKQITLSSNIIKVQGINCLVVQRGEHLYDPNNNTYQFNSPVAVNTAVKLDWEYLPSSAQNAAMHTAAVKLCLLDLEDSNKARDLQPYMGAATLKLKAEHIELKPKNILNSPAALKMRSGVRPYKGTTFNPIYPGG